MWTNIVDVAQIHELKENKAEYFVQILGPVELADWRACSEVDIDQNDIETTDRKHCVVA